jgi:hypothetical protein
VILHKKTPIQLFGPDTESVPITLMTGRQLEAALRYYAVDDIWTVFSAQCCASFEQLVAGQAIASPPISILRHEAYSP